MRFLNAVVRAERSGAYDVFQVQPLAPGSSRVVVDFSNGTSAAGELFSHDSQLADRC